MRDAIKDHSTGVVFGEFDLHDALAYVKEWRSKGQHHLSVVEL